jgi:hypothetical protein
VVSNWPHRDSIALHCTPLLLASGASGAIPLKPFNFQGGLDSVSEADIQALVQSYPSCLPIAEIDPMFSGPVPICRELNTPAGPIDNFMVTPSGLPVLVECKLWRNPEARRAVVGQILDYAKELSRWSSSDLQREVSRNLKREGNALLELVRAVDPDVDEIRFNDALTTNLQRGRFLLIIVGDGIREGVEAIADYLQAHAGLHFSLGLIEMPIFVTPNGDRLVTPRVLARANIVTRTVIEMPPGYAVDKDAESDDAKAADPEQTAYGDAAQRFWAEFLAGLKIDDPEQPIPKPARQGYLTFMLPAKGGSSWIGAYRNLARGEVGVQLSSTTNSPGDFARQAVLEQWNTLKDQLGGTAKPVEEKGRRSIRDCRTFGDLDDPKARDAAFAWLSERVNTFVNVLRPLVRSVVADYQRQSDQGT